MNVRTTKESIRYLKMAKTLPNFETLKCGNQACVKYEIFKLNFVSGTNTLFGLGSF